MKVAVRNLQRKLRINQRKVQVISRRLGRQLGLEGTELSLLLVNDRMSRQLNRTYRGIDMPTDVLSFPMYKSMKDIPSGEEALLGDIVINLHKAHRQARHHGNSLSDEITRLLIHGLLHLIGYDHEGNSYQAAKMRRKERELLNALKEMD